MDPPTALARLTRRRFGGPLLRNGLRGELGSKVPGTKEKAFGYAPVRLPKMLSSITPTTTETNRGPANTV